MFLCPWNVIFVKSFLVCNLQRDHLDQVKSCQCNPSPVQSGSSGHCAIVCVSALSLFGHVPQYLGVRGGAG